MELFSMISANLFGGVICLLLGILIRTGKVNFLIAGYNTMSKEEKAKVNIEAVCKYLGKIIILAAIVLLIGVVLLYLNIFTKIVLIASWAIFTVLIIGGVIYLNVNSKFKNKE